MEENMVVVPICKYDYLIACENEMEMICDLFRQKLSSYDSIRHDELKVLCSMLGIEPEVAE